MKQQLKSMMRLEIGLDLAEIAKIEFAFSQAIGLPPKKTCTWEGVDTVEVMDLGGNVLGVVWTPEESLLFTPDRTFYIDSRITLKGSQYQPETKIVPVAMNPTLFREASL